MFRGAIFDVDGVLVDTVPIHFKAWKKMFSEYGVDFTFDDYKSKVDGIPRYDGARAILKNLSDTEIKEAGDRKQRYFLEFIDDKAVHDRWTYYHGYSFLGIHINLGDEGSNYAYMSLPALISSIYCFVKFNFWITVPGLNLVREQTLRWRTSSEE